VLLDSGLFVVVEVHAIIEAKPTHKKNILRLGPITFSINVNQRPRVSASESSVCSIQIVQRFHNLSF